MRQSKRSRYCDSMATCTNRTWEALEALYPKVSPGGFVIVDDYILPPCRAAVDEYRSRHGIVAALQEVDGAAVYWQKEG
jgi:hypothetical protein